MRIDTLNNVLKQMVTLGYRFESGLNDQELRNIENYYSIKFPPDLKALLKNSLPVSDGFYNWRSNQKSEQDKILKALESPKDGLLFDVEHNSFWMPSWGKRPVNMQEALQKALEQLKKYPKLIPINEHRYISEFPDESGNPIFSIHQSDIIYYGENLSNYLTNEFITKKFTINLSIVKKIPFWSELVEKT